MNRSTIAILGAGNVGMALGQALVANGESVVFGVPRPAKYRQAVAKFGTAASIGLTEPAIAAGDLVILATPYAAAESIARSLANWNNRILVDATNPLPRDWPVSRWGQRRPAPKRLPKPPVVRGSSRRSTPPVWKTWRTAATPAAGCSCRYVAMMPKHARRSLRWRR